MPHGLCNVPHGFGNGPHGLGNGPHGLGNGQFTFIAVSREDIGGEGGIRKHGKQRCSVFKNNHNLYNCTIVRNMHTEMGTHTPLSSDEYLEFASIKRQFLEQRFFEETIPRKPFLEDEIK